MRFGLCCLVCALAALCPRSSCGEDDPGLLHVRGRDIPGQAAYDGGGSLRFTDVSLPVQVVHFPAGAPLRLPLQITYEVLEAAPIQLTSRMGTEYWKLYHYDEELFSAVYTDEKIKLAELGKQTATVSAARFGENYGPLPRHGLVAMRGHYYFLIDPLEGTGYLGIVDAPTYFDQAEVARRLTFTLADLSQYALSIEHIQSAWQPGGVVRARIVVTDGAGRKLPVVNVPAWLTCGATRVKLETEWRRLSEPSGWVAGRLPSVPAEGVRIEAQVTLQGPTARERQELSREFAWGDGRVSVEDLVEIQQGYTLPRNAAGVVRETRAIWASLQDLSSTASVDRLVDDCRRARLNVIVPDIFLRNQLLATSDLMPWTRSADGRFDPLGYLIEKAHAANLEVHPWFCVSYRDSELTEASEADWVQWQRQAVAGIVRATAEGVRQVRPKAKMSAAVFADLDSGARQGQHPAHWAREGWMDLIIPMDYTMQTLELRRNEKRFLDALADDGQLVSGLSLYMRTGTNVMSRPAELVREQIEEIRRLGIHGYCLFVHDHLSPEQLRMLREEVNAQQAVPYFR